MSNSSSKPTTISDSPSFSNPNPNPNSTPVENKQEQESDSQPLALDIDIENPSKKHKPLSSFTSPQPQPKKPKKKTNNVWTKSTSRKKPKKKPTNGSGPHPLPNGGPHTPILPIPSSNGSDPIHITPITRFPDKSDDSPDLPTLLSRYYKAEKVELSDDRLTAGSTKGYRMVRATRGVGEGAWYFEIKLLNMGKTGHTRLGWVTEKGDLQAPVGYDGWSYGYRDLDGSKVHKALREKYGEGGYGEGDVIGFYISLPDGGKYVLKMPHLVLYKGQSYMYPADEKDESPKIVPGSEISFYKNGECQGVAFTDLTGGRYYPAASMYTLPGEPNCEVRFNFGPNFEFFPGDFGGRPTPRPMSEVPYHGYEVKNEGPTKMRASP